jgi:hypothetical protein
VGGDSWEKQLEPVMVFVKDLQEDPNFVDWIKYLVRLVRVNCRKRLHCRGRGGGFFKGVKITNVAVLVEPGLDR